MARVSRSREEKTRFVAAWRVSGIGLHRFARENRISPKSLREWMALEASPPAFLPVAVVECPVPSILPSCIPPETPGHLGGMTG